MRVDIDKPAKKLHHPPTIIVLCPHGKSGAMLVRGRVEGGDVLFLGTAVTRVGHDKGERTLGAALGDLQADGRLARTGPSGRSRAGRRP